MRSAWALVGALVLGGCAGVPFGEHTLLEDPALADLARSRLPAMPPASQARWRATLHLGEPLELTLLVRVDGPGSGRVLGLDDLGNRLFDIQVSHEPRVHDLARGLPEAPLSQLATVVVDASSWTDELAHVVDTEDGRLAVFGVHGAPRGPDDGSGGGRDVRVAEQPPIDVALVLGGTADDAVWLECGRDGDRLGWARLQAWTPEGEGGFVYPSQLRIGVPGDHERLDARLLSWKATTPSTPDC